MNWEKMLTLYGYHCEGEVGRIITGGILNIPGKTLIDKLLYINNENDWVRKFTLHEPRGCAQQSVNLLLPAQSEDGDASFIVLQPDEAHALSGSNTICVATALLETGMLPMQEPERLVKLDTAIGRINALAKCSNGKVQSVQVDMCPSFAECLDVTINVPGIGSLTVDVGFGGCYFVMCDIRQLGIHIEPKFARELVEKGYAIKQAADSQIKVQHPEVSSMNHIEYVMFTDKLETEDNVYINGTIIYPGRVDRSPCGTGTSARMAVMHAKGLLKEGETIYTQSVIGGRFKDSITDVLTMADGRSAIIPRIEGRAWCYSLEHIGIEPTDPFKTGYTMSDTWGPSAQGL